MIATRNHNLISLVPPLAKLFKTYVYPRFDIHTWGHGLIEPKTWTNFKIGRNLHEVIRNSKVKAIMKAKNVWKNSNIRDNKFRTIRENSYWKLVNYNTIVFAHFYISQYESYDDFIFKVVTDKFAMQEWSSISQAIKAVLDAKRTREELDELEELIKVEEDDITSSEKSDGSEENEYIKLFL